MPDFQILSPYTASETSNFIQRAAKISAAVLLSRDHDSDRLYCRDMSRGLLKGYFWGEDYRVLSKPRSEGSSGQPEQKTD